MVDGALLIAATVGITMSGTFVYFEIGRYAAPQVPRSLFDERKVLIAYTAGLFVGVALSLPLGLFLTSLYGGSLLVGLIGLAILIAGMEAAQWLALRSVYFGSDAARPFYAIGIRAGASAILVLTLMSLFLGQKTLDVYGLIAALAQSAAVVGLEAAGGVLGVRLSLSGTAPTGGPISSALFTTAGFFFLGFGSLFGPVVGALVAMLILAMSLRTYRRLRGPVLGSIRPPAPPEGTEGPPTSAFGRTDR
ncbi:MAG: hypothetical protein L3K17_05270 [Thermoplasmata archaeon]|nr:hypothetical protein [Thermoplasmata archaeon]